MNLYEERIYLRRFFFLVYQQISSCTSFPSEEPLSRSLTRRINNDIDKKRINEEHNAGGRGKSKKTRKTRKTKKMGNGNRKIK